ncbi:MAG: arginase [Pseudomonadota bacterium]|nr:arginase [Pseudomonadota bacterium]
MTHASSQEIALIGYASGWGAGDSGCGEAPLFLKKHAFEETLNRHGMKAGWHSIIEPKIPFSEELAKNYKTSDSRRELVMDVLERLTSDVSSALSESKLPVVIGGDHSSAAATWSALTAELSAQEKFGLIWLDAHMDAHTPETRHQGKWGGHYHGQPLAALLGEGEEPLPSLGTAGTKLAPEHVTLIGIRSFEPGEEAFLKRKGVKVYTMDDVRALGFETCFKHALKRATNGTAGYGISIDMDGFDPEFAPAVGTPEKGGLMADDVLNALKGLRGDNSLKGLELVEFNPYKDEDSKTYDLMFRLLKTLYGEEF